jgi:hypothetical protein
MQITTRVAKTGTLALVVIGLGAGVVHGLPEPADVALTPSVAQDQAAWTMPLDGWAQPGSRKQTYAENLVIQPCLRRAGIDFPVPWATSAGLRALSDADETPERGNPSPALSSTRPLDADLARTRGYHGPSTAGANEDGMRTWGQDPERNAAFDRASQTAVERCFNEGYRTLGLADEDGTEQSASMTAKRLTDVAAKAAQQDAAVLAAAIEWRTCMAPSRVADLPASPADMPSDSVRRQFGTDLDSTPVQDAEVAVAERDVACQESSGYRQALYDAEWDRLLHVTKTDAAVLRAVEPEQLVVDRRLDRTIQRLAPEAPADVD